MDSYLGWTCDGPDGAGPDGAGPDGAGPDGAGPDGAGPDGAGPDGAGPDGAGPDGAGPDGGPRRTRQWPQTDKTVAPDVRMLYARWPHQIQACLHLEQG